MIRLNVKNLAMVMLALMTLPRQASSQLDSSCMVSALNRTAPVQEDGVWVLPNVPANLGQVRVRATCVEDGVVRFGASALVTVPANGVIKVEDIDFQGPPPVPASLSLGAPATTLTSVGQTVRLAAVATYPGGATADVTAAETGTDYRTSNPAIATVDADGLVTAHASGVALVSAVNEGSLGVIRILVVASGDSDGDGLPDDWELANGLDPNNPVDALDDQDDDGLSTLAELQAGLDPFNPDSDGDGLRDGQEVERGTNGLLADTDGDGLRDGLEVQTGSDPLDPNSFDLAAALRSIEVAPASFELVFNTVLGEASRQLRVTGDLIDGTSLDVTASRYGASYGSSDLQVISFGPEAGRVYAGQEGTASINVTVAGFTASAQARVRTFSPIPLSRLAIAGFPNAVAVQGDYAYVAAGSTGLQVVDVSDPLSPRLAGSVDTPGNANDVRVQGDYAYVADGRTGIAVVDIREPRAPRIVGREATAWVATDLAVAGSRVYVADEVGLSVLDVSDPAQPVFLGSVDTPGRARGVDVAEGLAVVADAWGGAHIISVQDPASPVLLGSTATRPDGTSNAADVVVREGLAYVADGSQSRLGGLRVIDFQDPTNPVVVGSTGDAFGLSGVALDRGLAVTSDYYFRNATPIFAAAPEQLRYQGLVDFYQSPDFHDEEGTGLAVRDGFVYMTGATCCIGQKDNGTAGNGALYIGRYAIYEEVDPDGFAPVVALTAPVAGAASSERKVLRMEAEARDDFRVESVQFLVNGRPVFTDYAAPYRYDYRIPSGSAPALTVGAAASDFAGRRTLAEPVAVAVAAQDPEPVVSLLSPVPGQKMTEGTALTVAAQASDDQGIARVELRVDGLLRHTDTEPPYRYEQFVPAGQRQIEITAVAYDSFGASPVAGPVVVEVLPDGPPASEILIPRDGTEVPEGTPLEIVAGAADDVGVRRVEIFVDGVRVVSLSGPEYRWTVLAPAAGETLRVHAVAEDTRFHRTSSPEVVVTATPDPLMTIQGRTVDESGLPVAGARVEAGGLFTLSDAGGAFALAGLPTNIGDFYLSASAVVGGFELEGDLEDLVQPLPGGVVEVGDVVLTRDDPGTVVTGRTVDEEGAPLTGAAVKVYNDLLLFEAVSGGDGGFSVPGVPASRGLTVSASAAVEGTRIRGVTSVFPHAGGVTDAGDLFLAAADETPDPGTTAVGSVIDGFSGSPVAGARVHVFTSFEVFQAFTGPDGTFSVSGVPAVDGDLFAWASALVDGLLLQGGSVSIPPEPGGITDLGSITLYPEGSGAWLLAPDWLAPVRPASRIARLQGGPLCPAP